MREKQGTKPQNESSGSNGILHLQATPSDAGQRVDVFLAMASGFSRSRIQSLIRDGKVISGQKGVSVVCKDSVKVGDAYCIDVPEPQPAEPEAQQIPLDIIYEDAAIIVLNKPAGMVVHPAAGHADGTIVNALLYHCEDLQGIGGTLRPGIVHRLDKDTSGLLVVAKDEKSMQVLAKQFQSRTVRKEYRAITVGIPSPSQGRIETEIGRSSADRKRMSPHPSSGGKHAITNYRVMDHNDVFAFVGVHIETGRTHQIRVHMSHIGCPIAGDQVYGARRAKLWKSSFPALRQMLHAAQLEFQHPASLDKMCFCAPVPEDMRTFAAAHEINVGLE